MKLYLCEGYDALFGPIRDIIRATSLTDANAKFLSKHGIRVVKPQGSHEAADQPFDGDQH